MRERVDRRALLALIGTAVGAGCNDRAPGTDTDAATATETATPTATATPPPAEFVIAYDHPTNVEVGQTVTITVTVTNTGGRAAAFGASPSMTRPGEGDTQQTGSRRELGPIAPGETVTVPSPAYDLDYLGRYTFRFGASAPPTRIRTRPATLAWGRAYQAPPGYQLRVGAPELRQTYSYVTLDGIDRERADPGDRWAFVPVEVTNPTDGAATAPAAGDFTLFPSDTPYDRTALTEQPIYQGRPYVSATVQPGGERSGYIPYAIPAGSTVEDVRVVWAASVGGGTVGVSWQSAGLPPYRG